ncbi:hypothetical protein FSARC_2222 [Fusarium sarcochroum]|uniref:Uncharacterized protein n=1 Tax=Fusarium sarcochroum TaxID=1208366 RepID=A0A8H4U6V2_9HYPO|nr:hypothetical protein FSARC_2222 [Fusarium sarcochroum]
MFKSSKPSKHTSGGRKGSSSQPTGPGFLFIVNKLIIREPERDIYHHYIPPLSPEKYHGEVPSKVMRYRNGEVSEATDFYWLREIDMLPAPQGQLLRLDGYGNYLVDQAGQSYPPAQEYKTFGVAACNPLLPIMVIDQDPLVSRTSGWELLRIFHPPNLPGLSQVVTIHSPMGIGGAPVLHAAGRSPSWMPSLLPETYRMPRRSAPRSSGLGGELPIILGLMALSAPHDTNNTSINGVFLGHERTWRRGVWNSTDAPRGHPPTASDDPSGFIVKVFFDPDNPYSNEYDLNSLEWENPIVREQ